MVLDIAFEVLFVVSFLTNIILLYVMYMFWNDAAEARSELDEVSRRRREDEWFSSWRDGWENDQ